MQSCYPAAMPDTMPAPVPDGLPLRASMHDLLIPRLRAMILAGDLAPTTPISELALSRRFGVSRTPLREALKVLAAEGLVLLRPHRSPLVAGVDPDQIAAVFETLAPLEALAARRAAERSDAGAKAELAARHRQLLVLRRAGDRAGYLRGNHDFHLRIAELAGNAVLRATIADLLGKILRARATANLDPARWRRAGAEHAAVLAAIASGEPDRAEAAMLTHSLNTAAAVLEVLRTAGRRA